MGPTKAHLHLHPEVAEALAKAQPVVALESALITHGLPRPINLETALAAEAAVRRSGAVPATIAVLDGAIHVGCASEELRTLASRNDGRKVSVSDLAAAVMSRCWAGTTVAATAVVAHRAGIPVLATGGIGGVHPGAVSSFDISSDLFTLARTPICVVCAGVKNILDIGLTLEKLESYGVPVIGYRTSEFPAFLVRGSGFTLEWQVESPEDAARLLRIHWDSGGQGVVLAQCPPEPTLGKEEWLAARAQAEAEAASRGIRGKAITPFLLQRIAELTNGRSIEVNRQLIEANAHLAGQITAALSRNARR